MTTVLILPTMAVVPWDWILMIQTKMKRLIILQVDRQQSWQHHKMQGRVRTFHQPLSLNSQLTVQHQMNHLLLMTIPVIMYPRLQHPRPRGQSFNNIPHLHLHQKRKERLYLVFHLCHRHFYLHVDSILHYQMMMCGIIPFFSTPNLDGPP